MLIESLSAAGVLAAIGASLRWNWWRLPKKGIPVLMYHKVGVPPSGSRQGSLWISETELDWQMRWLKNKGYQSVTFRDLHAGRRVEKPVILTFDDGYLNQRVQAAPILERHGMRGVFYVVTDAIGRDNFWHNPAEEMRIPMMAEEDLRVLARAGHEVGSHTLTHTRMDTMPMERAEKELRESKERLEKIIGTALVSFAFPYGLGEDLPGLVKTARDAGYRWVLGIHGGIWDGKDERNPLPRVFVRGDDFRLDFSLKLSRGKSRV